MRNRHCLPALLLLLAAAGCSSHAYEAEERSYAEAATSILVSSGLCSSASDCAGKELVKWQAGGYSLGPVQGGGVRINVYQLSSAETWRRLSTEFHAVHSRLPAHEVTLTAYRGPHSAPGEPWSELVIRRGAR